jgi:hypothetical protein
MATELREKTLTGEIGVSPRKTIVGQIGRSNNVVSGQIMTTSISKSQYYEGDYIVAPQFYPQVLETTNKYMTADVDILEVPVSITDNDAGGKTYSIMS